MDTIDPGLGFYTKVIFNVFQSKMNCLLKEAGLTFSQLEVLRYISACNQEGKTIKQRDIEHFFHISNPTVSVMLDRLEAKKFIRRVKGDKDKRVRYVEVTEEAGELFNDIFKVMKEEEKQLTNGLSEEEVKVGMHFLQHIFDNLTRKDDAANVSDACKTD